MKKHGPYYKLAAGGPVKLGKTLPSYSQPLSGLTDYVIEDGGNRFYVRRKSGGPATVVQTCENFGKTGSIHFIYVNGYVYYEFLFGKTENTASNFGALTRNSPQPKNCGNFQTATVLLWIPTAIYWQYLKAALTKAMRSF